MSVYYTIVYDVKYYAAKLYAMLKGLVRPQSSLYLPTEIKYRNRCLQLVDYMRGEQLAWLDLAIKQQIADPNIWRFLTFNNIVRAIADRLCMVFKNGIIIEAKDKERDQTKWDKLLDDSKFDAFVKELERMVWLTQQCYVKVGWITDEDGDEKTMNLSIIQPHYTVVKPRDDNPWAIDTILYPDRIKSFNEQFVVGTTLTVPLNNVMEADGKINVWTADTYKQTTLNGVVLPDKENPEHVNPYGVIPIVTFRNRFPTDSSFYQWPGEELVVSQNSINFKLTELSEVIAYQAHGVACFRNPPADIYGNVNLKWGPGTVVVIKDTKDEPGDFFFRNPNAAIKDLEDVIKNEYIRIFSFYGVNASDFVGSADAKSADALREENSKIDEYRGNVRGVIIPQLLELLEVMRIVWNTENPNDQITDAGVTIKIPQNKVNYSSVKDMITEIDWSVSNGYMSKVDAMLLLNDDMTATEAEERLYDNIEINGIINGELDITYPLGSKESLAEGGVRETVTSPAQVTDAAAVADSMAGVKVTMPQSGSMKQ